MAFRPLGQQPSQAPPNRRLRAANGIKALDYSLFSLNAFLFFAVLTPQETAVIIIAKARYCRLHKRRGQNGKNGFPAERSLPKGRRRAKIQSGLVPENA